MIHYKTHVPGRVSIEDQMSDTLGSSNILKGSARKAFQKLFRNYCSWKNKKSGPWDPKHLSPLSDCSLDKEDFRPCIISHESLETCPNDEKLKHELLDKLVILKLNGGLGQSMGCRGPKSAIEVRQDLSFLDLTVRQVEYLNSLYGSDVPLVLMNSFNTHEETVRIIRKYRMHNLRIHTFNQNCYPLINPQSLLPIPTGPFTEETKHLWYPPGHGDVYNALFHSGLLESLIKDGKEYIFISNVDNLGATISLDIMYHMINADSEFIMELTDKTRADVQGGTLVSYKNKVHLLESHTNNSNSNYDFNGDKHFNTNNLWVNLRSIQRLVAQDVMDEHNTVPHVVHRTLHGNNNIKTIQLETAAGAAIHHFKNFIGVSVPRSRFLPVKSSSDLFLVQSNLYTIKHGSLIVNPVRLESNISSSIPIVKLGREFKDAASYRERLSKGIPNIVELEHLTVSGDVRFGKDVTLKGTVILVANEGCVIDLPDGTILEDKVVTGNLRILDH